MKKTNTYNEFGLKLTQIAHFKDEILELLKELKNENL